MRFTDLLTMGGKPYHETHFAPALQMQGGVSGIALDIRTAAGRMPVLVTSKVKTSTDGEPVLIRTTRGRKAAKEARRQAEADRERLQEALAVLQQNLLPAVLPAIPGLEAVTPVFLQAGPPTSTALPWALR